MSKVGSSNSPSSPIDPSSVDPNNVSAWEQAQKQAEDAGILWERPEGDNRTAQEILDDTPLLRDLGNQSGVRDSLEQRVGGDIDTDADAAFRAAQVLEHIEKFDGGGTRLVGGDIGNSRVDGFTKGGDAKNGTEAGRLQDFGKYGFSNLKGELQDISSAADDADARKQAEELGIEWIRPKGDDRSASEIIDANPLLRNLGNQSHVKDMLKERVGDFENDADAAYRAVQVLEHIERFDGEGNRLAGGDVGNGIVNGFTKGGDAKHATEAGRLQDFGKYGFSHLKGKMEKPKSAGDDKEAREQAEKLGIQWERPQSDTRSAQDIIDSNPLLKNLGNQSGVKDMLKERVGDFEKDADAAFRAVQVLEHVEKRGADGKELSGGDIGNGSIDGFTNSGEARHGTEAGRLQDFGKYGFSHLKGEIDSDIASKKWENIDISSLETSEKGEDGNFLTVSELAWKNAIAKWQEGVDKGEIKPDDDRAKLLRALRAKTISEDGLNMPDRDVGGNQLVDTNSKDFEKIFDTEKIDQTLNELLASEDVVKDLTAARKDAIGKTEGGQEMVDRLKEYAFSSDFATYIQDLTEAGKKDEASKEISTLYEWLIIADLDSAKEFAQNMQLNAMTMELDSIIGDAGKISDENLSLTGQDMGKMLLTLIKKGGLDLGRRLAESEKFINELIKDQKTAKDFAKAMQELGALYSKNGEVTSKDVEKLFANGQYKSLSEAADGGALKLFSDLTKQGVIGSLGATVSLVSGIYQLAGKGGTLADTTEERLAIAKDFVSFLGGGKHFADLANNMIGDFNKEVANYNKGIDRLFENNLFDVDTDRLKKKPATPLFGLDKTIDDLTRAPSEKIGGGATVTDELREHFNNSLFEAVDSSKKPNFYEDMIAKLGDDKNLNSSIVKGLEDGYQIRPDLLDGEGKPPKGWHKGASAALLVMSAGADTFAGAADVAIGALTIEKGKASGDNVTIAKGALQVAAGGFGVIGGLASLAGLKTGLTALRAITGPAFVLNAILTLATLIPDIINDEKSTKQLNKYRDDLDKMFDSFEKDGLLTEEGREMFSYLRSYIESYGQRDAPDDIGILDYRIREFEEFMETGRLPDDDDHEDYGGDGENTTTHLDRISSGGS